MGFAGVAVVAAGRPSQQGSVFECDESQTAMHSASFDPSHARLHLVPPLLFPNDPLLPPSSSPPLPPPPPPSSHGALGALPRRRVSPGAAQQSAPPPGSPTSSFPSPPPLPPHVSPHPPPATAPSARYLAVGNLWEQLSKARLHLAEAMALARHWGRTLVLPRVRTSRIGATWHAPRVFDPVLMGRFVPAVRARGVPVADSGARVGGARGAELGGRGWRVLFRRMLVLV
ncbi:unnamed protein product [Closterium sp. Naga37s-1]|nr:unnamed protein product [Closterium sp. Naga37s-1]